MTTTSVPLSWIDEITMEQLERNPYPIYERLRDEAPLAYIPVLGSYVASSAEVCRQVATSPEFQGFIPKTGARIFGHPAIIGSNGDLHKDLRAMIDPGLQPKQVDLYIEDMVRPIARHYIQQFENDGKADLVAQFCEPVSVRAVGDFLGFKDVSSDKLREWFHKLSVSFANVAVDSNGDFANPEGFRPADEAKAEIRAVVEPLLDKWTVEPDDGAISHWLHDGMPEGQVRDRNYIYPTIIALLLGALQEPAHAMASTLAGLFTNPEQLEAVIDEPGLIPRAISEGIRWTSPIWSATARENIQDTTVAGVHLPAGSVVMLSYGSANHDHGLYNAPSEYDLTRPPLPHLAFGAGKHGCAGIYFANTACRIALEELFEAIPNLESDQDRIGFWGWAFRGPESLHSKWEV
ncbi:cytochrome P450 [Pseudarthrobacter sp. B4EP4b]|uniref:cytochrome P450 n=1 Tax=Pseudarthrobacter sp. B4EP4b TaxID=2590664 RepID=UPI00114F99D1|nr:cytochrome P450 [Pseudarthrobacter sp. B4EP4b]